VQANTAVMVYSCYQEEKGKWRSRVNMTREGKDSAKEREVSSGNFKKGTKKILRVKSEGVGQTVHYWISNEKSIQVS